MKISRAFPFKAGTVETVGRSLETAIGLVAKNGEIDMRQMHANLVGPASDGPGGDEMNRALAFNECHLGGSWFSRIRNVVDGSLLGTFWCDGRLDCEVGFGMRPGPTAKRQIGFGNAMLAENTGHMAVDLPISGKQEQAGGVLIQSMMESEITRTMGFE